MAKDRQFKSISSLLVKIHISLFHLETIRFKSRKRVCARVVSFWDLGNIKSSLARIIQNVRKPERVLCLESASRTSGRVKNTISFQLTFLSFNFKEMFTSVSFCLNYKYYTQRKMKSSGSERLPNFLKKCY